MTADDGQHSGWGAVSKTQLTGRLTRSLPNFEQRIKGIEGLATESESVRLKWSVSPRVFTTRRVSR